ncbi:amino acid adenylation domain-containing protein (plasmid) [Leptolyngbya boryana NIES-2135]|jgi:amino acid adenylation domain-containing protein|uniref:Amino acid adenylation domain-containing protein n=1 Tax=Leptolyngbya boryana NIES-2135 TaxID=1973484 RepID=A0A1Z4JSJ5_LEPBY|nr:MULTISPECIES: non-ribosomal peptide synthetase [Leptolyngbya]BAY59709.1 amino acid adenylation domain-containing protein [Leptolyngbya boryana NIES-2135]MBD2370875.1 non-ribosomal peptide synthetase [Leptolyngbya sp. FACHB-161]MBD2377279.1 non-ribosomal peptide synthetase [Leptolyngbya sp. FACHB-238]MBD2401741.1 non-ribosomal peptide synthetase [Leptolyngbya sp. FACHB-239]MBD2408208.1 non-ribosomal peptide synthetase [Leptolyngbya sp. FACHB-402]
MQSASIDRQQDTIEGYSLSPQQKHLWKLQQRDQHQPYRVQVSVQIDGAFDRERLKLALQNVVDRHEILRTTFKCLPGLTLPLQVIGECDFSWYSELNLSDRTAQVQVSQIEALFQEFGQLPFDFEQGSLFRVALVMLSAQKHMLLICLPALCGDGVAVKNLIREISQVYRACTQNQELTDEPLQYADIAAWQNELLDAEESETAKRYWRKLAIAEALTVKLPYERSTTKSSTFQPHVFSATIASPLVAEINEFAKTYECSTETFLLTCWQILLWRLTGQSEVVVNTAFSGRKYEELEPAIGTFVKYLPLYGQLSDRAQFINVLRKTEELQREADTWQEYFAWEEEARDPSILPFGFDFETLDLTSCGSELSWSIDRFSVCVDRCKLRLSCIDRHDGLTTDFHYDATVLQAEDIQRLAEQLQTLLESVIYNPQAEICTLNILSDRERHQLLVAFNHTQFDYPNQCFHHLFEQQVDHTPNNIAVVCGDQHLTYAELNARANQLAHYLRSLGVKSETLVGICVERSLDMLVGILGILKAGGAYVPFDPAYPQARIAFMLEDTQAPVVLTQARLLDRLPDTSAQLVCLDSAWETIERSSAENPPSSLTPDHLAYVIYTSGSTGKPKGTLIPHRGLVNYLCWCTQAYGVEQGEGALVHSSIAFDATITGLFAPLLVGSKVELLPEDLGIEALAIALQTKSNYSLIKITPAQLELLAQQLPAETASHRTQMFVIGGENLTAQHIAFWQTAAPETALVNEYGPTETVVGCCVYWVPSDQPSTGSIPIGRPIANTQLYLLDRNLQPVPTGFPGELYISGAGVARGYLNRPELTAERFIPNPFCSGSRLYKTGDLAQFLPNGTIEYLGRIDHQVKIRGFRIELGEIETVLAQHPAVQQAVVIDREDTPGDQRLVAYLVPAPSATPNASILRPFLQEKLPAYMVPSAFVVLKKLPLTSNGKVDRKALPAPEQVRPELEAAYIAPRNSIESTLAAIWAEVLGLEQIGVYDDFFDLGGHSLLLTQVTSRIHNALGIDLPMRQLFDAPTIAALAEVIADKQLEQADHDLLAHLIADLEQLPEADVKAALIAETSSTGSIDHE